MMMMMMMYIYIYREREDFSSTIKHYKSRMSEDGIKPNFNRKKYVSKNRL